MSATAISVKFNQREESEAKPLEKILPQVAYAFVTSGH